MRASDFLPRFGNRDGPHVAVMALFLIVGTVPSRSRGRRWRSKAGPSTSASGVDRVVCHKSTFYFHNLHFIPKLHGLPQFAFLNRSRIGIRHAYHSIGDPFAGGGRATLADDRLEILQRIVDSRDPVGGGLIHHCNLLLGCVGQLGHRTTLSEAHPGQLFRNAVHLGDGLPRTTL